MRMRLALLALVAFAAAVHAGEGLVSTQLAV